MKSAFRPVIVACAGLAALVATGTALAAFTSPKLTVSSAAGGGLVLGVEQARDDDAVFRLVIYVPRGPSVSFTQPAGTQVGTLEAQVQLGPGTGVIAPLPGVIRAADPTPYRTNPQALGCVGAGNQIDAVFLLVLNSPIPPPFEVPLYITTLSTGAEAAFAAAKMTACLPSPYVPEAQGGARLGAQLLNATLTFPTLFGSPSAGTELRWRSIWTPWTVGPGLPPVPNAAATVETQAVIGAAGRLTLRAGAYNPRTRRLAVRGSLGVAGTVQIFLGNRRVATARAGANGAYAASVRIPRRGTYTLRARATVAAAETTGCTATLPGVNCLRTTTAGFTATSATVRVRIR